MKLSQTLDVISSPLHEVEATSNAVLAGMVWLHFSFRSFAYVLQFSCDGSVLVMLVGCDRFVYSRGTRTAVG